MTKAMHFLSKKGRAVICGNFHRDKGHLFKFSCHLPSKSQDPFVQQIPSTILQLQSLENT